MKEAGALGFEPRPTDPKSVVLPLHHAPARSYFIMPCRERQGKAQLAGEKPVLPRGKAFVYCKFIFTSGKTCSTNASTGGRFFWRLQLSARP